MAEHVIHRCVVKIGASVLTDERGRLLSERMTRIADQVAAAGTHQMILVSSGAIACGMAALRLSRRPTAMAKLQACAAVGQSELMHRYTLAFGRRHLTTAQILLTQEDFADPARFRNAKQTLLTLLHRRVVPIVNENDTVSVEEITFGDNDRLAAMVAVAVDAQLLVILSDVDGFLKDGRLIERVDTLSEARAAVQASTRHTTRGGMASKLEAARIAGHSGIPMVIANGTHPTVLTGLLQGKPAGTLFAPPRSRLTSKKWRIAFALRQPKDAEIVRVAREAREAFRTLSQATTEQKNRALMAMAEYLRSHQRAILKANGDDVAAAQATGLSAALIDRLTLNEQRLTGMVQSVEAVAALPDPVGEVIRSWRRPNGLEIRKVRVPLGVIGIIYESRPNVTSDCASLCVKSGNAVILRGGAESFRSNQAISRALRSALASTGLPEAAISALPTADRAGVEMMLQLDRDIDVIIPRGGESLIRTIVETSRIPVIKHAKGVCHVYVDDAADLDMAHAIVLNAKCQRPATCNAMETLLVHERIAQNFVPEAIRRLQKAQVEVRGDEATRALVHDVAPATEEDWSAEYLDLILSVKVVRSLEEAIEHITRYGSAHSDAIVTRDHAHAQRFVQAVDSAAVYVNASTRFTDGFQFGLGAEIGISTDRLHARGPMGLEELTTYKYVVYGTGQLRE